MKTEIYYELLVNYVNYLRWYRGMNSHPLRFQIKLSL